MAGSEGRPDIHRAAQIADTAASAMTAMKKSVMFFMAGRSRNLGRISPAPPRGPARKTSRNGTPQPQGAGRPLSWPAAVPAGNRPPTPAPRPTMPAADPRKARAIRAPGTGATRQSVDGGRSRATHRVPAVQGMPEGAAAGRKRASPQMNRVSYMFLQRNHESESLNPSECFAVDDVEITPACQLMRRERQAMRSRIPAWGVPSL